MAILIVDDSLDSRLLIKSILESAGYENLFVAESARDAFKLLGIGASLTVGTRVDLILMDVIMPEIDGIEACRFIKNNKSFQDVPIIMVTVKSETENLQLAFAAGAMDYIAKPLDKMELLARVRSALRLKYETDRRKAREMELLEVKRQLEEANEILQRWSYLDCLTGIPNRRRFNEVLLKEWKRGLRDAKPLSLILLDIDFFKSYNDTYGHLAGDDCLKSVAKMINDTLKRPGDFAARYGGEEFVAVLPDTEAEGAAIVAEAIRVRTENMRILHISSEINEFVTVSLGVASTLPAQNSDPEVLIADADKALYLAKQGGRNRVEVGRILFPPQ